MMQYLLLPFDRRAFRSQVRSQLGHESRSQGSRGSGHPCDCEHCRQSSWLEILMPERCRSGYGRRARCLRLAGRCGVPLAGGIYGRQLCRHAAA